MVEKTQAGKPPSTETRRRGTGFPVVPLPEAARTLRRVAKHGPEHSLGAFAQYLGHGTSNSGPFRAKLAAFRDWKLVTTSGNRVVLTALGKQIAQTDEGPEEVAALRQAFAQCAIFASVYEDSAKGTALDADKLSKKAVLELGVAAASADTFVRSLIESAEAAGLAESIDGGKKVKFLSIQEDEMPASDQLVDEGPVGRGPGLSEPNRHSRVVVSQTWPTPLGAVVLEIRSSQPLPAAAYSQVAEAVAAVEKLANVLGHSSDGDEEKG